MAVLFPFTVVADDVLTIAVASNFLSTAREIATQFTQATHIPVRMSSASTGVLYAQIVNGAPFDVFLAADTERPNLLVDSGLAEENTATVYAIGHLVLWSSDPLLDGRDCTAVFEQGDFSRLAIANPRTAPYGRAAMDYLESKGLAGEVDDKLVFGENIAQAFQFVATGNARFGLVALSQMHGAHVPAATCRERINDVEIAQAGLVLSASENQQAANKFMRFMRSSATLELIEQRGYSAPANHRSESL